MKLSVVTGLLLAMLLINACSEPGQQAAETKAAQTEEKKAYIPVSDYLQGQIKEVDSGVAGILKRESQSHLIFDSVFITNQQFHALAQDFLAPELTRERFEKSFKENSFYDESIKSVAFTYEATDPAVIVRRVDVLIAPSLELDKIKSIYIEKKYASGDTAVEKKMTWSAGSDFSIVTVKSVLNKTAGTGWMYTHEVKVIWDPLKY